MNRIWILAVALLLMTNFTKAQNTEINNNRNRINTTTTQSPIKITKGYYAIYKNAEKLNHQPVTVIVNNNLVNNYTKGYYAIEGKHTQLHKGGKSFIAITPKRLLASKGYYSIKPSVTDNISEKIMADSMAINTETE